MQNNGEKINRGKLSLWPVWFTMLINEYLICHWLICDFRRLGNISWQINFINPSLSESSSSQSSGDNSHWGENGCHHSTNLLTPCSIEMSAKGNPALERCIRINRLCRIHLSCKLSITIAVGVRLELSLNLFDPPMLFFTNIHKHIQFNTITYKQRVKGSSHKF